MSRLGIATFALALCFAGALPLAAQLIPFPSSGSTDWGDWTFEWQVGSYSEGLELKNVRFKNVLVIHKASMPAVRVKYRGSGASISSGCGPFVDRIGMDKVETMEGASTKVIGRVFDDQVLEIAVFAEIGGYDLWQAWHFYKSGRLRPLLYSSGWSCDMDRHENDHKHHPYWRIDFDVEGARNHVWRYTSGPAAGTTIGVRQRLEMNDARTSAGADVAWTVSKPGSNRHVLIRYPSNELRDSGGSPWFSFSDKDVAIRRNKGAENIGWAFDPEDHLGYHVPPEDLVGQNAQGRDIVFWVVGHLFHQWSQSDVNNPTWHETGPVIDVIDF